MQSGPPPNILSVPPPLRYITFGTGWSSANALQISHFHTAYVQSRSANKHCNTACVQSRSANKHCNTAYMQSRSANKHCNTAYMQSRSANKHCNTAYMQSRSANSHGHKIGVYRTGPRPIRAARKYGLNGGRPAAAPHGGRGSPHSPASHLGRPLYIASPSVRNLRSTYAAYGLVHGRP